MKNIKKILIIEDEESVFLPLKIMLEKEGFQCEVLRDGEEAIKKTEAINPDFIILDLILPKMDGFSVLRSVSNNEKTKDIPVVILSNLGRDEEIKKGISLGAKKYFVKSHYSLVDIVKEIKSFLLE